MGVCQSPRTCAGFNWSGPKGSSRGPDVRYRGQVGRSPPCFQGCNLGSDSGLYANLHELIVSDYLRVEKSQNFFDLLSRMEGTATLKSPNVFMMIRPRGFGLSLSSEALCSVLERTREFAEGTRYYSGGMKKTLSSLPHHHVISLDFKKTASRTPQEFSDHLLDMIQELFWEHHLQGQRTSFTTPKAYFSDLITQLSERHKDKIVVLIDNYDIPFILSSMMEPRFRQQAVSIYLEMLNVIKQQNTYVQWAMLSGHIKFSLASELSEGLPLVHDLSSAPEYDTLFGFTRDEVMGIFGEEIQNHCNTSGITTEAFLNILESCYGGFVFSDRMMKVLCPACINHVISNGFRLLPYSAGGDYAFLRQTLQECGSDLGWLYEKDGQDPLFGNSLPLRPSGKQLGSLLIQLGFATRDRVTEHDLGGFSTWRYRFCCPNKDMEATLDYITGKAGQQDLLKELAGSQQ